MKSERSRFTLMPVITVTALALIAWIPTLSSLRLEAATPQHMASVVVRPGDTVWSIASQRLKNGGDVDTLVDRIISVNHLQNAAVQLGQRVVVPM